MLDDRLMRAAEMGNVKEVLSLIREFPYEDRDDEMYLALLGAANKNQVGVIKALVDIGANVNSVYYRGHTILSTAVKEGNFEAVELLLKCGADINSIDTRGKTALHYAISKKSSIKLLELLVDAGSDCNIKDNEGKTPLDYAVSYSIKNELFNDFVMFLKSRTDNY